jgi:chromosome segregation ATPase
MATGTAPIMNEAAQANEIRAQIRTTGQELTELRSKLARASGALAILNDKKQKLTQDAAAGRDPKPGTVTALNVAIDEASIPFDGLTAAVRTKEAALNQTREALAALEYDISIQTQKAARVEEVKTLAAKGAGITARINEMLAQLEQELAALGEVRKGLTPFTFAAAESQELAGLARAAIHATGQEAFMDGSFLAAERRLLLEGWTVQGDISLTVQNLTSPKRG